MRVLELLTACNREVNVDGLPAAFYVEPDGGDQLKLWRVIDGTHDLIGFLLGDGKVTGEVEGFIASGNVLYKDVPTFLHAIDAARPLPI